MHPVMPGLTKYNLRYRDTSKKNAPIQGIFNFYIFYYQMRILSSGFL